MFHSIASNWVY